MGGAAMSKAAVLTHDLSVHEIGEAIGMHPGRVSDLVRRGFFPHAYKGGRGTRNSPWRIPSSDLDDYRKKAPGVR